MASTVYYGKSTTAAHIQEKVVILNEASFSNNTLKSGDLLVVLFTQENTVAGPTLVLHIQDVNQNTSISVDTGKPIYDSVGAAVGNKAWNAGETVIFTYTALAVESQVPGENYGWFMLNKSLATSSNYGSVTIGNSEDNNSAVTFGQLEDILDAREGDTLDYVGASPEQTNIVGTLYLLKNREPISQVTITIPNFLTESDLPTMPSIPTSTSAFTNDGSISLRKPYLQKDQNIEVGTITASGLLIDDGLSQIARLTTTSHATIGGNLTVSGDTTLANVNMSGNVTIAGGLTSDSNGIYIASNKKLQVPYNKLIISYGSGDTKNIKQYIQMLMDGEDSIDTFSLYRVYSKNLVYGAGSAKPKSTKTLDVNGISSSPTTYSDTVVKVELPVRSGYKVIAVVGYNITEESRYADSSAPSLMNVYQCRHELDGGKHYARCQMRNMSTSDNTIYISFQILYQKTS